MEYEALDVLEQSIHNHEINICASSTSMMFCTSCGTALEMGTTYCTEGGEQQ